MDLQCSESVINSDLESIPGSSSTAPKNNGGQERQGRRALVDPTFIEDRVIKNMLKLEERHMNPEPYFRSVQNVITVEMRRVVACWMHEVIIILYFDEFVFFSNADDAFLTDPKRHVLRFILILPTRLVT